MRKTPEKSRMIFETRFEWLIKSFDSRGKFLEEIQPKFASKMKHWNVHNAGVVLLDEPTNAPKYQIGVDHQRIFIIYEDVEGGKKEFIGDVQILIEAMFSLYGSIPDAKRMGLRFISVFGDKTKTSFNDVKDNVFKAFNFKSPFTFPITDVGLTLTHNNGRAIVGPVEKGEKYISTVYGDKDLNMPDFGYNIDIDTFAENVTVKTKDDLLSAFEAVLVGFEATEQEILNALFGE